MNRSLLLLLLGVLALPAAAQQASPGTLTVKQIMQDPRTWVGVAPSDPVWSEDGETLYFQWNPQGRFPSDSLYEVPRLGGEPVRVPPTARRDPRPQFTGWHHGRYVYDDGFQRKVYAEDGDLFLYHRTADRLTRLTHTRGRETDPRFTRDGAGVVFVRDGNLYRLDLAGGAVTQVTDLRSGTAPADATPDAQDRFLAQQQRALFDVVRRREAEREAREAAEEREDRAAGAPPTFYTGRRQVRDLQLAPGGRYASFALYEGPGDEKATEVQDYVTETGYAKILQARPKVGAPEGTYAFHLQDLAADTTFAIDLSSLPGVYDVPAYRRAAAPDSNGAAAADSARARRGLVVLQTLWAPDGRHAVLEVRARDNKDRWLVRLDPTTRALTVLDRQVDEAWIAGPGIPWYGAAGAMGWLPDGRLFFQSERSGYSHLYAMNVGTGAVTALTEGDFEVFDPMLSRDGATWYFTSSEGSPFERHFYRMPAAGGARTRLTALPGENLVRLGPDERTLAILRSTSNHPPELFLQPRGQGPDQVVRITHSTTPAWQAYPWREPEIIRFEASDGARVPARVYRPANPNGAAVLFVHGAGYLQNVHRWWSSYFREYMFHNLLADRGYLVLDVDYRGSAGYGRDWRTAIYRHMGGRDLQDFVDASRHVQQEHGIDPERVFIYGGSYGGFITLMALFTEPEHFGGGAALRAVTDWAHYNHPYTANILNTPAEDSLAFARSSPIYFAEGLEDPLLIAHGMVDTNVQFQDVVRLAQRLIELGKEDWELAVYPVEGHGFTEPESWTDEYRRILELIEQSVGPAR